MRWPDLAFASFLAYATHPESPDEVRSRNFVLGLKKDKILRPRGIASTQAVVLRLSQTSEDTTFADWLHPNAALVPVPGSSLMQVDSLWVPERLAIEMTAAGFGYMAPFQLQRKRAVPKAAFARTADDRPSADDHYQSLVVKKTLESPAEILLVDDVVTTGATLLGCAQRLREAFPGATVRGFAAVRSLSDRSHFHGMRDPCVGTIRLLDTGGTTRKP